MQAQFEVAGRGRNSLRGALVALAAVACALLALIAFQLYSASRPVAAPSQTVASTAAPAATGDSSDTGYVTQKHGHGNLP